MKRGFLMAAAVAAAGLAVCGVVRGADPDYTWREYVRTYVGTNGLQLTDGKVWIGSALNQAEKKTLSGDLTMTREGVVALADNAVPASEVGPGTLAADVVVPVAAITNALRTGAWGAVIPTSTNGLATGRIWNDGGTLKVK